MHLQGFHGLSFPQSIGLCSSGLEKQSKTLSKIEGRAIPPERIGLNGEYDHAGLSKRASCLLAERFDASIVEQLRISQRGQVVVILSKMMLSDDLLHQMVALVLQLQGASSIEINGVRHFHQSPFPSSK